MDACTTRNTLIYAHDKYKLEINKDKGKLYTYDKLTFQGFAFKALMHCLIPQSLNDDGPV